LVSLRATWRDGVADEVVAKELDARLAEIHSTAEKAEATA